MAIGADDNAATIQVLGSDGTWQNGTYYWWNADPDQPELYPAGWFDADGNEKPAVELDPGEGVFFATQAPGISLQSAGQVSDTAQVEVPVGGVIRGNVTPLGCKLSDITLAGAAVDDNAVTIQVLGADGTWQNGTYYWWNADPDQPELYPAGWFDADGNEKPDLDIPAGGCFFITTMTAGVKLQFPTVL